MMNNEKKQICWVSVIRVTAIILACLIVSAFLGAGIEIGIERCIDYVFPSTTEQGAEKYDKGKLAEKHCNDLDSGFFVFPDSIDGSLSATYESKLRTGLFDTVGYIILETEYNDADFNKELQRLKNITCRISSEGETVSNRIEYDENMYKYPAYISMDGYDDNYEYALIDKASNRIIYIHLAFPEECNLRKYDDYLKINSRDYAFEVESTLDQFTIYAHKFEGSDDYDEYER